MDWSISLARCRLECTCSIEVLVVGWLLVEYKMSNADLISGRDCKDVIVELDRSDVAEMLDGVSGGTGRRDVGDLLAVFFAGSSSSGDDDDDQKDRDGCVVGWCDSDGGVSLMLLLEVDLVVVSI
mmetsp:Transcript_21591/g.36684  ORF Transcript_21591/g.36684 Transcript_21591/m.36684 type:complete len:125 (+) Transcript_21591:1471-1845(+)